MVAHLIRHQDQNRYRKIDDLFSKIKSKKKDNGQSFQLIVISTMKMNEKKL